MEVVDRVARTNAFKVVFFGCEIMSSSCQGARELIRICCTASVG